MNAAERDAEAQVERALMARDIVELRGDVAAVRADVAELVALFKGAKAVVRAVKWIGGLGAGVAAIWAVISPFFPHWGR